MKTEEVATKLVELCRKGEWIKAIDGLYAKDIVSVEARAMGWRIAGEARDRPGPWQNRMVAAEHGDA